MPFLFKKVLSKYFVEIFLPFAFAPLLRLFECLFSSLPVVLQMLLSKATHNWGIHKAINLEEASDRQSACNTKSQTLFK